MWEAAFRNRQSRQDNSLFTTLRDLVESSIGQKAVAVVTLYPTCDIGVHVFAGSGQVFLVEGSKLMQEHRYGRILKLAVAQFNSPVVPRS